MAESQQKTTFKNRSLYWKDRLSSSSKRYYKHTTTFIRNKPLGSFFIVLGLLLLLLLISRFTEKQPTDKTPQKITKDVQVYSIGEGPLGTFQAKIQKSGVVQIIAQAPGIVQKIPVKEGDKVGDGQQLISLSSNYQGGSAASVQRQIAQTQYQNVLDTFGVQNDLLNRQRDVATASAQSAQDTRDISRKSVDETNSSISNNQTQLDQIDQNITTLQQNNVNGANNAQISQLQTTSNTLQGAINQLRASSRTSDYQSAQDKPPTLLSDLQKQIALKQLDVQQKGLDLNKEVAHLQVNLASVNEAIMYPASPFAGTVEKISVKEGQAVNAGTVLATIASTDVKSTATLLVPQNVAQTMSLGEPSQMMINGKTIAITPYYVSSEATDGQLYSVFYDIPKDEQSKLNDGEYVSIKVPFGTAKKSSADPLIPIDSVYQTQDKAYVLVANKNNTTETRIIKPSNVFGDYVEVQNGLRNGDQIILNRNVIAGDKIKIQ